MKSTLLLTIAFTSVGLLSFQRFNSWEIEKYFQKNGHRNAAGAPTGKTGAPGEQNCTGCHGGAALDGSTENILTVLNGATPVTSYVPGQTYTIALSMSSAPAKKGFQATALDANGNMAGTFTAGTNTQISGTTRKYANHTSASNTNATQLWGWTWIAPTINANEVTFYVATNKTNANGTATGDQIFLSQHVVGSSAGIDESSSDKHQFVASYQHDLKQLLIRFNTLSSEKMHLTIRDLSGKLVLNQDLGDCVVGQNKELVSLPSHIASGTYIVHFLLNNTAMSAKIQVH
jgi:hypothetical protein